MQLKFDNLKPLAIVGAFAIGGSGFLYGDIDQYSRINTVAANTKTSSYLEKTDKEGTSQLFMKSMFQDFVDKWKLNTMFSSSAQEIIEDANFKNIVAMRLTAVPFIIEEIKEKPSLLVWALNLIYDTKISNSPNTTIEKACKLWVRHLTQ